MQSTDGKGVPRTGMAERLHDRGLHSSVGSLMQCLLACPSACRGIAWGTPRAMPRRRRRRAPDPDCGRAAVWHRRWNRDPSFGFDGRHSCAVDSHQHTLTPHGDIEKIPSLGSSETRSENCDFRFGLSFALRRVKMAGPPCLVRAPRIVRVALLSFDAS